jgi:hypothetical protein
VGEVKMAEVKEIIFGNALWYEIDCAVKSIVAKSVYLLKLSHIKETALF